MAKAGLIFMRNGTRFILWVSTCVFKALKFVNEEKIIEELKVVDDLDGVYCTRAKNYVVA